MLYKGHRKNNKKSEKKGLTITKLRAIITPLSGRGNMIPVWYLGVAQMVARYLGVVEAASSNLVTQTK